MQRDQATTSARNLWALEPSRWVVRYAMGWRSNRPAARYTFTTAEMPPIVSKDVPIMRMRRGGRARLNARA